MKRTVFIAGAAAAFLLASLMVGQSWAQTGTRSTSSQSSFGVRSTSAFGTSTSGFGSTSGLGSQTGGNVFGGTLQQGYGAATGQSQLGTQNRNLSQLLNQNRNTQTTQNNNTNMQNQIPIRIQVATMGPRPATVPTAAPVVEGKLSLAMAKRGSAATAMWEGDVLVLSGTVANESVRRTIEGIALLQPGVRTVRNETVVGPVAAVNAQ